MRRCNESNPENPEDHCIQPEGRHSQHYGRDGEMWPNARVIEEIARAPKRRPGGGRNNSAASPGAKKRIWDIAAGAEPERHVNPAADGLRRPVTTHAPEGSVARWNKDAWTHETKAILRAFLHSRREPFTTPEHLWPLIDSPNGDMRAMSVVVQHALRNGWMEEIDSVRLRDVYRTRDGVEFAMNKLVPIYRSIVISLVNDSKTP